MGANLTSSGEKGAERKRGHEEGAARRGLFPPATPEESAVPVATPPIGVTSCQNAGGQSAALKASEGEKLPSRHSNARDIIM